LSGEKWLTGHGTKTVSDIGKDVIWDDEKGWVSDPDGYQCECGGETETCSVCGDEDKCAHCGLCNCESPCEEKEQHEAKEIEDENWGWITPSMRNASECIKCGVPLGEKVGKWGNNPYGMCVTHMKEFTKKMFVEHIIEDHDIDEKEEKAKGE